jgi:hypothetical protein
VTRLTLSAAATFTLLAASAAHTQPAGDQEAGEPFVSAAVSTGYVFMGKVDDGQSLSIWDFSGGRQYRLTLDRYIGQNTNFGATVGYASLPLAFSRTVFTFDPNQPCPQSCDASADMWTAVATLRVASSLGWHHVIEANVGLSIFDNFREDLSGNELGPIAGEKDITFTLGYGGGWSLRNSLALSLVGDIGFSIHHRSGRAGGLTAINPLVSTRFVLRTGLGH